jgi:hypothetical protein
VGQLAQWLAQRMAQLVAQLVNRLLEPGQPQCLARLTVASILYYRRGHISHLRRRCWIWEDGDAVRHIYMTILSRLLPAGAVGVSVALSTMVPGNANEHSTATQPSAVGGERISERLATIREAVSTITEPAGRAAKPADGNRQLA